MNAPLPIRTKLVTAALSISLLYALSTFEDIIGARSSGDIAFRVTSAVFAVLLAFFGVFRSAQLQLLWGWGLAVAGPFLIVLCVSNFRGSDLKWGLFAALVSLVGGYLLLADAGVRDYRENIKRRHVA